MCVKGRFGHRYLLSESRLNEPQVKSAGCLKEVDWDQAIEHTVQKVNEIKEKYGNDSVAVFASPKLSNEELYLLQKLTRTGLGSNNISSLSNVLYGQDLYGLDYDQNLINMCNLQFHSSRINLEVDPIPFKAGMFDLVICNQVLEHLKNYQNVINHMIHVTKMGGYIIIGIPNLAHLINRIYLMFGRQPMCIDINSSHVRGFAHKNFALKLSSTEAIKLIDFKGSLMYPLPFHFGKMLSKYLIGLSGYVCYLLKKV
jgi:2-polyprenyl-3-methyl-5-hydroxy-6-metoxy-1,4-benzoquinol methylase